MFLTYFPTETLLKEPPIMFNLGFDIDPKTISIRSLQAFATEPPETLFGTLTENLAILGLDNSAYIPLENCSLTANARGAGRNPINVNVDIDKRVILPNVPGLHIQEFTSGGGFVHQERLPNNEILSLGSLQVLLLANGLCQLPVRNTFQVSKIKVVDLTDANVRETSEDGFFLIDGEWYFVKDGKLRDQDTLDLIPRELKLSDVTAYINHPLWSLHKRDGMESARSDFKIPYAGDRRITLVINFPLVQFEPDYGKLLLNKLGISFDEYHKEDLKYYEGSNQLHPSTFVKGKEHFGLVTRIGKMVDLSLMEKHYGVTLDTLGEKRTFFKPTEKDLLVSMVEVDDSNMEALAGCMRYHRIISKLVQFVANSRNEYQCTTGLYTEVLGKILVDVELSIPVFTPRFSKEHSELLASIPPNLIPCGHSHLLTDHRLADKKRSGSFSYDDADFF